MLPDGQRRAPAWGSGRGRDNLPMHLLIPFAAPLSDAGRQASATLQLPQLQRLLAAWTALERDDGDEWSLSPPHERALARSLGWVGAGGCLPWGAHQAGLDGLDLGMGLAWGLVTPVHWHLGTDQVSLVDPAELQLGEADSRALFKVLQSFFADDGYTLRYGTPQRWYAAHESFAGLPCASLDRVIGRNVDAWLGNNPQLQRLRRLQSEAQMLLHGHPVNEAREALGLLPVNSFWLSGCGPAQLPRFAAPQTDDRLRSASLAENWAAWTRGWNGLDAGPLTELLNLAATGAPARLTLCGERSSIAFEPVQRSLWQRLRTRWAPPRVTDLLETL